MTSLGLQGTSYKQYLGNLTVGLKEIVRMPGFKDWSLPKKMGWAFGINVLILIAVVSVVIFHTKSLENVTKKIHQIRVPTSHTSMEMLNGINHSLAALRGWVILGEEKFKSERIVAWNDQIEPSLNRMTTLSKLWTNPENRERLNNIQKDTHNFKIIQEKIESIAHTAQNNPAKKMFFEEVAPLETLIMLDLKKMITQEIQNSIPSSFEKLQKLTELEVTFPLVMTNVDQFLLSGKKEFRSLFFKNLQKCNKLLLQVKKIQTTFSKPQQAALNQFEQSFKKFDASVNKVISIRAGEKWNLAQYGLEIEAIPTALKIKENLKRMVENQDLLLNGDVEDLSKNIHFLVVVLVLLLFLSTLLSGLVGSKITRDIKDRIRTLSTRATNLAMGKYRNKPLSDDSNDEFGQLSNHLNTIMNKLISTKKNGNLDKNGLT